MKPPVMTEEDGLIKIKFLGEVIFPIGEGHFLIESWSEDEAHHAVDTEDWSCSCRGYECTRDCRHIEVIRRLVREATQKT